MALTITITDPKIIRLLRERAEAGGLTVEQTIEHALKNELPRHPVDSPSSDGDTRSSELWALVQDMQARMNPTMSREDYDDLFFDEHGLPK